MPELKVFDRRGDFEVGLLALELEPEVAAIHVEEGAIVGTGYTDVINTFDRPFLRPGDVGGLSKKNTNPAKPVSR